jgi:DNA polymerase III gamma/tau subunit
MENPDTLASRDEAVNLLETLLVSNRVQRFDAAEKLAKDKVSLQEVLQHWQAYWRDVFLLANGSQMWIRNVDRLPIMQQLIQTVSVDEVRQALESTRRTLHYLSRNVNTRLAVEALLLDYPRGKLT